MPVKTLKRFLDEKNVRYVTITHSLAFTAQEVAESAHIRGKDLAKTVIVIADGRMAMAVVPATCKVDLDYLRRGMAVRRVALASEKEFKETFPDCELGAMPPFGNLYGMDVFVDKQLAEDREIAFNAGSHTELVRLAYEDFERLVHPIQVDIC
jgi:Ala-tRNA(Pro) deacylase